MPTPTKPAHTPTPWHAEQASDGHFMIHETEGKSGVHEISLAHVKEERNAAFIVKAVNAHEKLLELVKRADKYIHTKDGPDSDCDYCRALAQVEGK